MKKSLCVNNFLWQAITLNQINNYYNAFLDNNS